MSYRIDQKIGKHVYVYDVYGYWDKGKQQARQKRVYVGKRDPKTNKIIPAAKKKMPKSSKSFGDTYFLDKIFKKCGIMDAVESVFNADESRTIKQLCMYKILNPTPFYLHDAWLGDYAINESTKLSSQRISEFLVDIGRNDVGRDEFFGLWSAMNCDTEGIFYDITSFSSYSRLLDLVEWGYNRDKDCLPQVNFGVAMGLQNKLPLFYETYPGSINDVVTLKNILKRANSYGFEELKFVLDRGFFSTANIEAIIEEKYDFIIPLPMSLNISEKLIKQTHHTILSPSGLFYLEQNRAMFHQMKVIKIGKHRILAHIFSDEKRKSRQIDSFAKMLEEIEAKITNKSITKKKGLEDFFVKSYSKYRKFFKIIKNNKGYTIARDDDQCRKFLSKMGKMILVTMDNDIGKEDLISLYLQKDSVEKCFDNLKNELEDKRLHVSNNDAMSGKMFLNFISLVAYTFMSTTMKSEKLFKVMSIKQMLLTLKKIKCVEMADGSSYLTEITKEQKNIFRTFDMEIPSSPCY